MKKTIQAFLQWLLGFDTYLFLFAIVKIKTLRWEPQDKEGDFNHFCSMLQPTDLVLDIGANIGIMSALMARQCRQGQVFAYEPVPDNVVTLNRVLRYLKLKNVTVFPFALGTQAARIEMKMPVLKGVRMQGLSHVSHESIEDYDSPYVTYEVEQYALDHLLADQQSRIAAIKMDVENYEQFILTGAIDLLSRHQPMIYCELWDNENRQRCFEILQGLGYEIRVLIDQELVPFDSSHHTHHNFFFLPGKSKPD